MATVAPTALSGLDWEVSWAELEPDERAVIDRYLVEASPLLNLPYVATLKQMQAHLAPAYTMEHPLLYGGGMGGAKSAFLCGDAIKATRDYEQTEVLMGRFRLTSFRDTTLKTLLKFIDTRREYDWNRSDHTFTNRRTGSVIKYAQLGSEEDVQRLGSSEYGGIYVDEAAEIPRAVFEMLQTRLRHEVMARDHRLRLRLTANPAPGWLKQDFIKRPVEGYKFLRALYSDNPHLYGGNPEGYARSMRMSGMPEERLKAWLDGDWDAFIPEMACIPSDLLDEAIKRTEEPDPLDVCWGVDVGYTGKDYTSVWGRAGLVFRRVDRWVRETTDATTDRVIALYWSRWPKPTQINVDIDGIGGGVYDQLVRAQREGRIPKPPDLAIVGVHAQGSPTNKLGPENPLRYKNVKSENIFKLRGLLESGRGDIEDPEGLVDADLAAPYYDTPGGVIVIEKKELVSRRIGRSPDDGDALLLSIYRGHRDEIAGRTKRAAQVEMTPTDAARLEAERQRATIEERTLKAIEGVTGRALGRRKKRPNDLSY